MHSTKSIILLDETPASPPFPMDSEHWAVNYRSIDKSSRINQYLIYIFFLAVALYSCLV